jgi:hypothetical protein
VLCILYHEVHLLENILILIVGHTDLTVLSTEMCFVLIPTSLLDQCHIKQLYISRVHPAFY